MRPLLQGSVVLLLVGSVLFGSGAAAQEATPLATPMASPVAGAPLHALFVQAFTTGRLEPGAEAGTATLTLLAPVGETVYFSDQPERIAGVVASDALWQVLGPETAKPLHAALILDRPAGDQVVALELVDGSADAAGTVTYTVRVLPDTSALGFDLTQSATPLTDVTDAFDFGPSHLFVVRS
jgi:hypothetical protein